MKHRGEINITNYGVFGPDWLADVIDWEALGKQVGRAIAETIADDDGIRTGVRVTKTGFEFTMEFLASRDNDKWDEIPAIVISFDDFIRFNCDTSDDRDQFVLVLKAIIARAEGLECDENGEIA